MFDDPYEVNRTGVPAFTPVLPDLEKALGPGVVVDEPDMWHGPEVELSRRDESTGETDWTPVVAIRLDRDGATHVMHLGQQVNDERASALLGLVPDAFTRGRELAAKGLAEGVAAMNPSSHLPTVAAGASPYEGGADVGRDAQQRLSQAQKREVPQTPGPGLGGPRR